ncbi:MAG: hypothetical protein L6U99_06430 [Clostridium sp.]|nr:MAG: hypothetical protein L6U99_06430 [Clostridium sp.]
MRCYFSKQIDSLAAAGAILASVWTDNKIPTIDNLGNEFFWIMLKMV